MWRERALPFGTVVRESFSEEVAYKRLTNADLGWGNSKFQVREVKACLVNLRRAEQCVWLKQSEGWRGRR